MTAAVRALPRYDPDLRRHSWKQLVGHQYRCRWCGVRRTNHEVRPGQWYVSWLWPQGHGGDTARGDTLPDCPGPKVVHPLGTAVTVPAGTVDTNGRRVPAQGLRVSALWPGRWGAHVGEFYDLYVGEKGYFGTVPAELVRPANQQ